MTRTSLARVACFSIALALDLVLVCTPAPATLDLVVAPHSLVQNAPVSDCSSKAKASLTAVLQNAVEVGDGTGEWIAHGIMDNAGQTSAYVAIHCFPVDTGYLVTFTCAAQVPPNPDTATSLCAKIVAAFGPLPAAAAPAPTRLFRRVP